MNFIYIESHQKLVEHDEFKLNEILGSVKKITIDENKHLYIDKRNMDDCYVQTDRMIGYTLGYVRDYKLEDSASVNDHNISVMSKISSDCWPLDSSITGSFSAFVYDKRESKVIICNDPIGLYPLYYYKNKEMTIISSHLIATSMYIEDAVDEVGVIEKMLAGDYCNFGSRTIINNVKSILPGEKIIFDNNSIECVYDNTLYNYADKIQTGNTAKVMWSTIKEEFNLCLKYYKTMGVATSGGLDSRVILGALDQGKDIHCLTYTGSQEDYEAKLSKRCANVVGASFESFSIYKDNLPNKEVFLDYVLKTEATGMNVWLSILEHATTLANDSVMLVGDICDLLTAKSIKRYRSRSSKVKAFFKYMMWGKDFPLTRNTPEEFTKWKFSIVEKYLSQVVTMYASSHSFKTEFETLRDGILEDLEEMFKRIEDHSLKYVEQLDELFAIYTHGRISMGKQLVINKKRFFPLGPIQSMRIARESTSIDLNKKFYFKLLDPMFKYENDLKALANVPTAQIPFIPYKSNNLLKLIVWGMRSTLDQILIKRQMRKKDSEVRHRVLKSINWVKVYQAPNAVKNVTSWFDVDYIGTKEHCINATKNRSTFSSWPYYSFEITSLATLNLEIELINKFREQKD